MRDEGRGLKDEIVEYFSGISAPDFGVDARFFPSMGRRLVELSEVHRGARVLDVAAGRGASMFPAASTVGEDGKVIGIDLAEGMVRLTLAEIAGRGLTNVEMLKMDAEELEFHDETFDFVLCGFALFFLPNLARALSEFSRVLKPGGTLAVSTFGEDDERMSWYEELLRGYGISRPDPVGQSLEKPADLDAVFTSAGFTDVRVIEEEYDSVYEDEEEWWDRLWASGDRQALEKLEPDVLKKFKSDAFDIIGRFWHPDGIHRPYRVLFTLGRKPSSSLSITMRSRQRDTRQ